MKIPEKLPGLRPLLIVLGVFTAVWISLEGALWSVAVMGVAVTAVSTGYAWQKYLGGRSIAGWRWLVATAGTGLIIGLFSGVLTLLFMAVKTGLHAHGPEFSPEQIIWVIRQTPIWTGAGLLAGLGLGLVLKGRY